MKLKIFAVRHHSTDVDLILFLLRLIMGIAFVIHGSGKIQNPMHWMGDQAPVPGVFQLLAAVSEFGGGIALILGFLTRLGALGIAFTMLVAVATLRFAMGDPFVNPTGGGSYELASIYLALALLFIIAGPGRFSLDCRLFGQK